MTREEMRAMARAGASLDEIIRAAYRGVVSDLDADRADEEIDAALAPGANWDGTSWSNI